MQLIVYVSTLSIALLCRRSVYDLPADSIVPGAQLLTVPEGTWSVPCDAQMQLTLTFDLLDVVLKEDILIQKLGDICLGTIIQWPDSSASEYFLGSSFMSAVYL